MTKKQLLKLGFEEIKSFDHDEWNTKRFEKGVLNIELTSLKKNDKLTVLVLNIDETFISDPSEGGFSIKQIKELDKILN